MLTDPVQTDSRWDFQISAYESAHVGAVIKRRVQETRQCGQTNDPDGDTDTHVENDAAKVLTKLAARGSGPIKGVVRGWRRESSTEPPLGGDVSPASPPSYRDCGKILNETRNVKRHDRAEQNEE